MSVKIHGHEFYTASEVSAMTPSGTIDSQWETYDMPLPAGATLGWQANRFFVNKVTGLVVGWIGLHSLSATTGSWPLTVGTIADCAIHPDVRVKYSGNYEYGTGQIPSGQTAASSAPYFLHFKEMNGIWDTTGKLVFEGVPSNATYKPYWSTIIEHYCHIGSKYGVITTEDVKAPIYLKEGAFYDKNTAALICGKAWLRIDATLPSGYTSGDYVTFYKNLWSGEVIMNYSLHPTTAGSTPAITMPSRVAVVDGRNFYTDVRYTTGFTTPAERQNTWMRLANTTLSFSCPKATWLTGSLYYPSNPETGRTQIASYETTNGLWIDEVAAQVPSAQSSKFPTSTNNANNGKYAQTSGDWYDHAKGTPRSGVDTWVWRSKRTGMVFTSFDWTHVARATYSSPLFASTSRWGVDWIPSYRYNKVAGTSQPVYFSGAGYLGTRADTTGVATSSEYTCNIMFSSGKSLGAFDTTNTQYGQLGWGTSGQASVTASCLLCFTGQYLGNTAENIVR